MCVTFFYFSKSKDGGKYKLILINNRDEFLDRKTLSASWMDGVLCGRDLKDKARGTWLGVTSTVDGTFKLSNILSVTSKKEMNKLNAISRGEIVINYLKKDLPPQVYCNEIEKIINEYNGFTLITMEKKKGKDIECYLLSTKMSPNIKTIKYTEGIYGIGNSGLDESYKKVSKGKELFSKFINDKIKKDSFNLSEDDIINECLQILKDNQKCLPDPIMEKLLEYQPITPFSSLFIAPEPSIRYGTRTHTVIIVDNNDRVTFFETTAGNINSNLDDIKWIESKYTFQL
ncbi:Transport and Golgi organization protein 2 homolog [Strongyloides ratti]|uniref:Transport and Golgi organization protein 2 homolog n=1 Tax=Strongyloides ratti TaxID=34506 RepID=A0A090MXP9_STRRB|nr:Transport and Golgi organization protein 2 homolog [Strongyloides ratti]CEF65814.1 Transport and Golgi organization protein 2 homolog [Strongyloides ratti]